VRYRVHNCNSYGLVATPEEFAQTHASIWARSEAGTLAPKVGLSLPLTNAADAHEEVITHSTGAAGNIVLEVD
jgi:NADPH:quinone reductase-like Zn-dependent oxidoreductase